MKACFVHALKSYRFPSNSLAQVDSAALKATRNPQTPLKTEEPKSSQPERLLPHPDPPNRERATGIEPAFSAWEADVLPLNYARIATPRAKARYGSLV